MSQGWTVQTEVSPRPEHREAILAPLEAWNMAQVGALELGTLCITVRGPDGAIAGGLWGSIGQSFLRVELIALGPARGQGLGRRLMAMAEEAAREAGLRGLWLDTGTFQAPGFYEKLGFVAAGRIEDDPPGHARVFYVKRLDGAAPDGAVGACS